MPFSPKDGEQGSQMFENLLRVGSDLDVVLDPYLGLIQRQVRQRAFGRGCLRRGSGDLPHYGRQSRTYSKNQIG